MYIVNAQGTRKWDQKKRRNVWLKLNENSIYSCASKVSNQVQVSRPDLQIDLQNFLEFSTFCIFCRLWIFLVVDFIHFIFYMFQCPSSSSSSSTESDWIGLYRISRIIGLFVKNKYCLWTLDVNATNWKWDKKKQTPDSKEIQNSDSSGKTDKEKKIFYMANPKSKWREWNVHLNFCLPLVSFVFIKVETFSSKSCQFFHFPLCISHLKSQLSLYCFNDSCPVSNVQLTAYKTTFIFCVFTDSEFRISLFSNQNPECFCEIENTSRKPQFSKWYFFLKVRFIFFFSWPSSFKIWRSEIRNENLIFFWPVLMEFVPKTETETKYHSTFDDWKLEMWDWTLSFEQV